MQIARDGMQALELFDVVNPDLVLLDVMLPRSLGSTSAVNRKRSQVPIIMVTAKTSRSTPSSAWRSGPTT